MKKWIFGIFLKKAVKRLVMMIVSYVAALQLAKYGVTIDMPMFQEALFGAIWSGIEAARQWVKVKYPDTAIAKFL